MLNLSVMPRRKTTRVGAKKPKPKLPEGNDGDFPADLDKKAKLDIFLKDFDEHVKIKLQKMESGRQKVLHIIEKNFMLELHQMPQVIKSMTLKEFIEKGGDAAKIISEYESDDGNSKTHINQLENSRTQHQRTFSASATRALSRINMDFDVMETIPDDEVSTIKSHRTKSKVIASKNRKKTLTENMPPPPPSQHSFNPKLRTPASRGMPAFGFDTPLVTPKFDPRLPITPAQARRAKPGEVMMSLGGSPLQNPYKKNDVHVRGQTLTVSLNSAEFDIPEEMDLDSLPLKEKVAKLIDVLSMIKGREDEEMRD